MELREWGGERQEARGAFQEGEKQRNGAEKVNGEYNCLECGTVVLPVVLEPAASTSSENLLEMQIVGFPQIY